MPALVLGGAIGTVLRRPQALRGRRALAVVRGGVAAAVAVFSMAAQLSTGL